MKPMPARGTKEYEEMVNEYVPITCEQYRQFEQEAASVRYTVIDELTRKMLSNEKNCLNEMFWRNCIDDNMETIIEKADTAYQSYIRVSREKFAEKLYSYNELAEKAKQKREGATVECTIKDNTAAASYIDELAVHC